MDEEETKEFAQDMVNYLNETGNYQNFIAWMVERGHDKEDVESNLTKIEEE